MIRGVDDGVGEACGVRETEVDLAGFGFIGLCGGGTNVCLERVETEGYDLFVGVSEMRGGKGRRETNSFVGRCGR